MLFFRVKIKPYSDSVDGNARNVCKKYSWRFKKRTQAKFVITVFHCLKLFRDGKSTCLEDFEPEEPIGGMSGRTGPTRIEAAGPWLHSSFIFVRRVNAGDLCKGRPNKQFYVAGLCIKFNVSEYDDILPTSSSWTFPSQISSYSCDFAVQAGGGGTADSAATGDAAGGEQQLQQRRLPRLQHCPGHRHHHHHLRRRGRAGTAGTTGAGDGGGRRSAAGAQVSVPGGAAEVGAGHGGAGEVRGRDPADKVS